MEIRSLHETLSQASVEALVVGLFSDQPLAGPAGTLDKAAAGLVSRLIELGEVTGKLAELTTLYAPQGVRAPVVVLVGCGPRAKFDRAAAYRAAVAASRQLSSQPRGEVAFAFETSGDSDLSASAVCGAIVGTEGPGLYRAEKKRHAFKTLHWGGADQRALDEGRIIGTAVNLARRLVNEPPDDIYPESFAHEAEDLARQHGLSFEGWDQRRLEAERCGSLLAVAKGSSREPRLVILGYRGAPADQPPLALVGKGVTFDSGGLSLKTSEGMVFMKCDMAGAATVVAAMTAIAQLRLPINVIGLAGLVENMPGPGAVKLGDVLRARNGRTIEVHNTDAEGRLVLADVLDVAVERGAARIVDLATLTGSCVVALGNDVAGLMTNDQAWGDRVLHAASSAGELLWQLPMFPHYRDLIESEVADIKNVGDGRWGGTITAAKFLEEFVSGKPWVHLDIAGPSFLEKPKSWLDSGATGNFVRTLVELARHEAAAS